MQRRAFTRIIGAGAALLPLSQGQAEPSEAIKVGVVTHSGGGTSVPISPHWPLLKTVTPLSFQTQARNRLSQLSKR